MALTKKKCDSNSRKAGKQKEKSTGDALDRRYGILLRMSMADIKYNFDR